MNKLPQPVFLLLVLRSGWALAQALKIAKDWGFSPRGMPSCPMAHTLKERNECARAIRPTSLTIPASYASRQQTATLPDSPLCHLGHPPLLLLSPLPVLLDPTTRTLISTEANGVPNERTSSVASSSR